MTQVTLKKSVETELKRLPKYIATKFLLWVSMVEEMGLREVRTIKSYHDEPLKGKRFGQRSIRLNRAYRAIYRVIEAQVEIIEVVEVNNHEY